MAGRLRALRGYFAEGIWRSDRPDAGRLRRAWQSVARMGYAAARSFAEHDLLRRAASLTFYMVLSIVPLLAFAFSVLKGLWGYEELVEQTLVPWIRGTFAGNPQLVRALETTVTVVAETDVGRLGALGLAFVVYAAVGLLAEVASAFNAIWGASRTRSLVRQVTDFVTLIVLAPIGLALLVSIAATLTAMSTEAVESLRRYLAIGPLLDLLIRLVPLLVIFGGLTGAYVALPTTRSRPASAALGAALATVLWYVALVLHVRFQIGVAKYSALYAGFAAIPIFLFWAYVSWTVVLIGAVVAATHQYGPAEGRARAGVVDQALREALALEAMARVVHAFYLGRPPGTRRWTLGALAQDIDVMEETLEPVLDALARAGHVVAVGKGSEAAYVLARPADELRASEILETVRHDAHRVEEAVRGERGRSPAVREVLEGLRSDTAASRHNVSLRVLASRWAGAEG